MHQKLLEGLWCEDALVPPNAVISAMGVEDILLRESTLVRQACADFFSADDVVSPLNIMAALRSKQKVATSIDKYWSVEETFFCGFVGEPGEKRMGEVTMEFFPTETRPISANDCLGHLNAIERSKLYQFVGPTGQSTFNYIKGLVTSISQNCPPSFIIASTQQLQVAHARAAFFCRCEVAATASGTVAVTLIGKAPIQKRIEAAACLVASSGSLDLTILIPFQVVRWLLDKPQIANVDDWADELLGGAQTAPIKPPNALPRSKKATESKLNKR